MSRKNVLISAISRRVYVLVDSRRGVLDVDEDMMSMLNNAGLPYQVNAY